MKKVLVTIEMNIDEQELAKIENYEEDYNNDMTVERWVEGLKIVRIGDGNVEIGNGIEEYFNRNIGTSRSLVGIEVKKYEIVE